MTGFFSCTIVFGIITLSLVEDVRATRCYDCSQTAACNDLFDSEANSRYVRQCPGSCVKYKMKDDSAVVRQCSYFTVEDGCVDGQYGGKNAIVCSCSKDRCNTASYPAAPKTASIFISLLILYFKS